MVSHECALRPTPGGVQRCTQEYMAILGAAGLEPKAVSYREDRRWLTRLRRKLFPRPYRDKLPPDFFRSCLKRAEEEDVRWIFLNHCDPLPMVAKMKQSKAAAYRYAFLSHGIDSTDFVQERRIDGQPITFREKCFLGEQLFDEVEQRKHLDLVCCLSGQDEALEKWLGAKQTLVFPRICQTRPLPANTVPGRIGMVATLNHPPNWEGVRLFAEALTRHAGAKMRLVGGPAEEGAMLAREFPIIEYLGFLDDERLEQEAATWACFVNPLFCMPRGVSTKLAVGLEWGIPVATTRAGARGYRWDEKILPLADGPDELARLALRQAEKEQQEQARMGSRKIADLAPTLAELGDLLRKKMAEIENSHQF